MCNKKEGWAVFGKIDVSSVSEHNYIGLQHFITTINAKIQSVFFSYYVPDLTKITEITFNFKCNLDTLQMESYKTQTSDLHCCDIIIQI